MARQPKQEKQPHLAWRITRTVLDVLGKIILVLLIAVGTVALIAAIAGSIFLSKFKSYVELDIIPKAEEYAEGLELDNISLAQTSIIYYTDPKTGEYRELQQLYGTENRIWVSYDDIPLDLVHAAISIEDKRFPTHKGVDWIRTLAAVKGFAGGSSSFGGSTITQQLIKNLSQEDEVTVDRKVQEIFRALEVEKRYTKSEIMEWYLNTIYLGEGCYGVQSAARVYFGKKVSDLRLRTKYGITITRVNRAGMDLIPYQGLELQVGDRVMVVGPAKSVAQVADVLGNSLKKLDHPNLITIFVGIALGVLLGSIPLLNVPQPVKLGLAGGPLIVAILIGRFGTHFHLVTYTTMSANLMLREIGIALFLAAVGIGAGDGFIEAIADGGYRWIGYGFIITVVPLLIVAVVARKWLRMNYYTLMGLIAGSTTDPPALAYANATAGNDMPAVGYSTVYPVVMFLRVLTAQIFILFAL